ncbi:MAG: hypothetical protein P8N76_00400 [Pirellulaceae bacterium]|nr:hypothetical protein [Pirellulaceae bacterium]
MKLGSTTLVALALIFGIANVSSIAQEAKQQGTEKKQTTTKQEPNPSEARVEYARVYLELSKVELQQVLDANKRVAKSFSPSEVQRRRLQMKVAELQLKALQQSSGRGDAINIHLLQAKERAILAKQVYLQALENPQRNLLYSKLELERLRLVAELAQLRVDTWSNPKDVLALIDNVYWQIDLLSDQLANLQQQIERPKTNLKFP